MGITLVGMDIMVSKMGHQWKSDDIIGISWDMVVMTRLAGKSLWPGHGGIGKGELSQR